MTYSDLQLKFMAIHKPSELMQILNSPNADINTLVSGIEILGAEIKDDEIVFPILKKLLYHMNVLVREAAIIGIIEFYVTKSPPVDILEKIKYISESDPSYNLRVYAKDVLKDFENLNV